MSRLLFTGFLFLGVLVSIIMLSPGVESQLYKVSVGERGLEGRPHHPALHSQGKVTRCRWWGRCRGWEDQNLPPGGSLFLRIGLPIRRILFITTAFYRRVPGVSLSWRAEAQAGHPHLTLARPYWGLLGLCVGVDPCGERRKADSFGGPAGLWQAS